MLQSVIWKEVVFVTMFIDENQNNFPKCALWSSFEDDVVTNEASTCKHFNCSFPSENEDKNHLHEPLRKCNCESSHVVKKFSANHVFYITYTITGQASFCILQPNAMSKACVQFMPDSNQGTTYIDTLLYTFSP